MCMRIFCFSLSQFLTLGVKKGLSIFCYAVVLYDVYSFFPLHGKNKAFLNLFVFFAGVIVNKNAGRQRW